MSWFSKLFGGKSAAVATTWVYHVNPDWKKDEIKGRWKKWKKLGRRTWVEMVVIEYRDERPPDCRVEIGGPLGYWGNMETMTDVDAAQAAVEYAMAYFGRRGWRVL